MAKRVASSNIEPTEDNVALFRRVTENGTKTTCFFNNKGGVGKTTLVANLGAELALNFHAKVLVVDADPQCNLTQYVLPDETTNEIYLSDNPESIFSVVRPLSFGKGYESALPIRASSTFGFDIIIGDPRLALQEDLLAGDWRDAKGGGMRGLRTTYVFAELVRRAKELRYDFVFFDMGPSLGAINRAVLLAMDSFVVPMSIDVFSLWSIKNIGTIVSVWQKDLQVGLSLAEEPEEVKALSPRGRLLFLGYVVQQHKERTGYDKKISAETGEQVKIKRRVQAYEDIGAMFPDNVLKSLGTMFSVPNMAPHLYGLEKICIVFISKRHPNIF